MKFVKNLQSSCKLKSFFRDKFSVQETAFINQTRKLSIAEEMIEHS